MKIKTQNYKEEEGVGVVGSPTMIFEMPCSLVVWNVPSAVYGLSIKYNHMLIIWLPWLQKLNSYTTLENKFCKFVDFN